METSKWTFKTWAMFTLYRIRFCSVFVIQFATLLFGLKRSFTKTRFRSNFCSDKSVQTCLGLFKKPIRYWTFHFQQRSGAVLFRSRNCFENSVSSVNRSPVWYTFCNAPFHYPVQCEHHLKAFAQLWVNEANWYPIVLPDQKSHGQSAFHFDVGPFHRKLYEIFTKWTVTAQFFSGFQLFLA